MRWVAQPRQPRLRCRDDVAESFDSCEGPGAGIVHDQRQEGGGGGRNFVEDGRIAVTPDGPGRKGGNSGKPTLILHCNRVDSSVEPAQDVDGAIRHGDRRATPGEDAVPNAAGEDTPN